MSDETGWLEGIGRVPTMLYGGYPGLAEDQMYPQAIVLHVAQGTFSGLIEMAGNVNARASYHFSHGREGQRAQHVSLWNAAWHAGIVNNPLPEAQRLIAQFGQNPNTWSIGIEMEGFSAVPPYSYDYVYSEQRPFPAAMVGAVIATIEAIRDRCQWLKDLSPEQFVERIITHSAIDQLTRRQDPGDYFMESVMPIIRQHFLARPVTMPPAETPVGNNRGNDLTAIRQHAQEIVRLAADS